MLILLSASRGLAQDNLKPVEDIKIIQRLNNQVPLNLAFRDENCQRVTLQNYFAGKPVILVLAYYRCPRLCSLVLNKLTESLRSIDYNAGPEFTVLAVSFDPREQPELAAAKKQSYVASYGRPGTDAGWHFLTGEEEPISRLADSVGFRFVYDPKQDQFAHASGIMILTPEGRVSRYFYGLDYPPRDLRFGLEDASGGRIGSPVTQPLRLLCYAYDPATGQYRLLTMRLVQGGGILTVLALGITLLVFWRRERQRSRAMATMG
jgi:protein SCO1/2